MSQPIIEVKNLGKRYMIGEHQPYLALRDNMAELIKKPFNLFKKHELAHPGQNEFWALKDINFKLNQGDTLGIIGRNGAGKSTLLKILSQITPPTTGNIHLRGRVASLLEVGTGFHPELTGRENIYLNGALLGMKKWEIKQKFDQIVEFADISKFLDTPVKRYSSGMYVRLAFSVAAHLDPDILIVDEVLAVGDTEFQKKCLGKMEEVTNKQGRTILLVSHNMGAIANICKKGILLKDGKIEFNGKVDETIDRYMKLNKTSSKEITWSDGIGDKDVKIYKFRILNKNNEPTTTFPTTEPINIEFEYECKKANAARIGFSLWTVDGAAVFTSSDADNENLKLKTKGYHKIKATIPGNLLNCGNYYFNVAADIACQKIIFHEKACATINIIQSDGVGGYIDDHRKGIIRPLLNWKKIK